MDSILTQMEKFRKLLGEDWIVSLSIGDLPIGEEVRERFGDNDFSVLTLRRSDTQMPFTWFLLESDWGNDDSIQLIVEHTLTAMKQFDSTQEEE